MKKYLFYLFTLVGSITYTYATTCAGATAISTGATSLTCGTTNDISGISCGSTSYQGGLEALYTYSPAFTGSLTIDYSGQTYTGIFVWDGCPTSGGTCIDNITSSSSSKSLTVSVTTGTTYYIMFDTWPSPASPCAGTATLTLAPPSYCNPAPSSVDGSGITNVTFGNSTVVNNTTGTETNNYGDYTAMVGNGAQGTTLAVDITYSTGYTYGTKIWVDWNNDLDFVDAGEEVYFGLSASTNPTTLNASFLIPLATPLGNYRMRIGGTDNNSGPSSPCYTGSYGSFEDYTLNVTAAPSCLPPTALGAFNIASSAADLFWTENGTSTEWDVEWGTAGFVPAGTPSAGFNDVTNDTVTLAGLSSDTDYEFYVRADCAAGAGSGQSTWVGPFAFTTAAACGDTLTGLCYSQTNTLEVLASFSVDNPGDWATLTFLAGGVETCCDEVVVYDGPNATGNIIYGALSGGGLSDYSGEGTITSTTGTISLAINSDGSVTCGTNGYTSFEIILDCVPPPSCLDPTALGAFNVGSSSADLFWTENGTATEWDVEWGATGFVPAGTPSAGLDNVTNDTTILSGLTAQTTYDFYVRADCGAGAGTGQSNWVGPFTFTTACSPTTVFPACTDFSVAGGVPTCWSDVGTEPWIIAGTWPDYGAASMDNSGFLGVDGSTPNSLAQLQSEPYDLSAGTWTNPPRLSFDIFSNNTNNPGDNALITVEVSDDNGASWSTLTTYQADAAAATEVTADLSAYSTDVIVLRFNVDFSAMTLDEYYNDILINNVCVEETPSCLDPSALGAFNIASSAADLFWTENGTATEWDVEWGTAGFVPAGTPSAGFDDVTNDTVTLAGLSSGTDYEFYVRADCAAGAGSGQSLWVGPFAFTTSAACGDTLTGLCYSQTNTLEVLASFTVDNPGDWATLTFLAGQVETCCDEVVVYDGPNGTGNIIYGALTGGGLADYSGEGTITSTTGTISLAINSDGSVTCSSSGYTSFEIILDCMVPPACPDPTALGSLNVLATSADIYWTENGTATEWDVEYGVTGFVPSGSPSAGFDDVTNDTVSLTGLTANTTYDFYVRADCAAGAGTGQSNWVGPISFTTAALPPANDDISGAIEIPVGIGSCTTPVTGTNVGATDSGVPHSCAFWSGGDVWYYVIVPASGEFSVEGTNIDFTDGGMQAYSGPSNSLTSINCDDDDSPAGAMPAIYPADGLTGLTPGDTIWFAFWEYGNNSFGDFELCAFTPPPPPANDECANATPLSCGDALVGETTVNSNNANASSVGCFSLGDGVWYSFAGNGDDVTVTVDAATGYDPEIAVASSSDCVSFTNIDCEDGTGSGGVETITFSSMAGTTYYIYVGYYATTADVEGDFDISISCVTPPPPGAFVWNGSAGDNDWSNGANWDGGTAPAGCADDVFIADVANMPIVAGSFTCGDFSTATNADVEVQITGQINVCGDVTLGDGFVGMGDGLINLLGTGGGTLVTSTGTAEVSNVVVESNYSLASGQVDITGSLTLNGGDFTNSGTIVLVSDATGTAYLDDFTNPGNSYVGDITVQRYVTAGSGLGQRYFGSAVNNGVVSGLDATYTGYGLGQIIPNACDPNQLATGSPYSNLFEWNEPGPYPTACAQEGWYAISAAAALTNGRAYSGWMNDGSVLEVTGTPNTGTVNYGVLDVTGSGVANADGWHLLANPFPSPMNVNAVTASGFGSPQYYNAASGAYSGTFQPALIAGSEIPIMQGFVAQTAGPNTYSTDNSYRVANNNPNFFKSTSWYDYMLTIDVDHNGNKDVTYLFYSDDNTTGFDIETDCVKRHSDIDKPTLYTKAGSEEMSLNGYHLNDLGASIPMGLIAPTNDTYTFSFDGMDDFPANTTIYIEDTELNIFHNVNDGPYSFQADPANNGTDRFEIHFVLPASFDVVEPTCSNTNGSIIELTNDGRTVEFSTNGTIVETGSLDGSTNVLAAGNYDVEVFDQYGGSQSYSFVIDEVIPVTADIIASASAIEEGQTIDFEFNGSGATATEWFVNGTQVATTSTFTHLFDQPGTYTIEVFAANLDCDATHSYEVTVAEKVTSIIDINGESVEIYSYEGNVYVNFENTSVDKATIELYNLVGQKLVETEIDGIGNHVIENQDWADGYYIVKLTKNGTTVSKKLLLTK